MADKAEANRLKRVRRAQEKLGDKFVQEDAYRQREFAAQSARTTTLLTAAATKLIIPLPFQPQTLKAKNPDLWAFLSSGKPITATKSMDPMQAAAIWYLELDAKHSFNTSLKVPGANFAVAVMASYEYLCDNTKLDVTPALLIPYVIACHEKRFTPDIFIARDEFINLWLNSPDDLPQYGRRQCDRITKVARDLRKAINEIGGSDPFAQMKQDLEEALNEDVDTSDLSGHDEAEEGDDF
ncbi:hypothetical protein PRZ48_005096 [Zasmidium cellare]|uniref:Uncharacterized protein n=1 Tax=Zasmidium cellare TaxID=395010 RepID=A0ABR0ESS4_ZASCE|nr:hypothetical protein PRZ48_005096 [Zasmidium cellare]